MIASGARIYGYRCCCTLQVVILLGPSADSCKYLCCLRTGNKTVRPELQARHHTTSHHTIPHHTTPHHTTCVSRWSTCDQMGGNHRWVEECTLLMTHLYHCGFQRFHQSQCHTRRLLRSCPRIGSGKAPSDTKPAALAAHTVPCVGLPL